MIRPAAILQGLAGGAAGTWRRAAAIASGLLPGRLSRLPLLAWLAIAGGAVAVIVLAWLAASPGERREATVELDIPRLQADRRRPPAGGSAASSAPAGPDRIAQAGPDPANALSVPAATADAFAAIPLAPRDAALAPAPDPALTETADKMAETGALPRRGDDGRVPWQVYARPFSAPHGFSRVSVIVAGLGSSPIATSEVIRRLPGAFTLAFEPRADDVGEMARAARAAGHEILLGLPVQDDAFPFVDRGPDALAPDLPAAENRARLERLLGRFSGYVGVMTDAHERDGAGSDAGVGAGNDPLALAREDAAARGLLFVESGRGGGAAADGTSGLGAPLVRLDLTIGADLDGATIDERLAELERAAEANGFAVAVASPTPIAAARLAAWSASLREKNLVLAPVSAIPAVQAIR